MSFHVYSASQSGNNDYAMYMYAYVGTKVAKILVAILPDFDVGMKLLLAIHRVYMQAWLHVLCYQGNFSCITSFCIGFLILEPCILLEMIWLLCLHFSLSYCVNGMNS